MPDRKGHDRRYAINASRITAELGWKPQMPFDQGMALTIRWYMEHEEWWQAILDGSSRA